MSANHRDNPGLTTSTRFEAHVHRGGVGLLEMRLLLQAFAEHGDFEQLKHQAYQENLLGKTSSHIVKALLAAFRRRFLLARGMPPALLVGKAMHSTIADAAKVQILFPYFICTDPLIEICYRSLVLSRLERSGATLNLTDVSAYLVELSGHHLELARWSEYLRLRWSRGFCTLLRRFGLMESYPGEQLRRMWLLPEPFGFFWFWFWEQIESFWEAYSNSLWEILQTAPTHRDELLAEGQLRSWWHYSRAGEIVSFEPRHNSAEEWLRDGLA